MIGEANVLLTIAIPTFNRGRRLEKSLADLLRCFASVSQRDGVSVLVSNNGSTDDTSEVVAKWERAFQAQGIAFRGRAFPTNLGFDANVLACYMEAKSEYVWFLSDDDNVLDGAIDGIVDDIVRYRPSIAFYNFDQAPYRIGSPIIANTTLFSRVDVAHIEAIAKLIEWPKLTSIVVQRHHGSPGNKVKSIGQHFMHVAIALQTALDHGAVLHSARFVGRPDDDYKDHINFPPHIGNALIETTVGVLKVNDRTELLPKLRLSRTDPFSSCLNMLGSYYRGRFVLTPELKASLFRSIREGATNWDITSREVSARLVNVAKFLVSFAYAGIHLLLTGRRLGRMR
jgi:glycosyltransferase involved in cell wall biosynthesis